MNARPIATAHHTSGISLPDRIAFEAAHSDSASSRVSSMSGLLCRAITTAIGVTASASPASVPAAGPKPRRTTCCTTHTAATPAMAWGSSRLQVLNPKIRADSACTHRASGGLSTVMNDPASIAP
nr:hypothetical protein [Saccharopolyspora flava]